MKKRVFVHQEDLWNWARESSPARIVAAKRNRRGWKGIWSSLGSLGSRLRLLSPRG